MTRRLLTVLSVSLLAVALASGFAFAQERTKVTVWLIGQEETGSYGQVWKVIKEHIENDLPHIEVDMQFGVSPDTRYTVAYAAGIAPDVVTLATQMAPAFINQGMVSPLDFEVFGVSNVDEFRELFYAGALRSIYFQDEIYYFPVEVTTWGMYYNPEMMDRFGVGRDQVPRTWDELITVGKRFMQSADGETWDTVGLALNRGWRWPSYRYVALLRQAGTDWLVNGEPMFDSPQAIEAISLYASLFHENQITHTFSEPARAFINQQAAFYLGPSYEIFTLRDQIPFEWATAAYPAIDVNNRVSTSYAWGLFVNSQSQVKKEAWEVVKYLTSERWAPTWLATSSLLIPRAGDWILDVIATQPQLAPFIMELEVAQLELFHEKYGQIVSEITTADNQIIARTDSVSNILTQLNERIRGILMGD